MTLVALQEFKKDYVNPRGLPRAEFIEDVASMLKARGVTVDTCLIHLREMYAKYKILDQKLSQNQSQLNLKIPEIKKGIELITFLSQRLGDEKKSFNTYYGLTESVFCNAEVPVQETVFLWLGANVMVEYSFEEAIELLTRNLSAAELNHDNTNEDLSWLREQQNILEVNIARVFNYDVMLRKEQK